MTKRITILLAIMLFCLLGLLVMQSYLAYQEFQRQQADFIEQVNELFRQTVQMEKEARVDRLVELFIQDLNNPEVVQIEARPDPERTGTVFEFLDPRSGDQQMSISFSKLQFVADTMSAPVRQRFLEVMEKKAREDFSKATLLYWTDSIGARIERNYRQLPFDTAVMESAFRHKLDSLKVESSFSIAIDTTFSEQATDQNWRQVNTEPVALFGESWVGDQQAMAIIDNPGFAIFRRSLFTIGGSAAVILLTLLSFYLLFATILRQKKLSEMKDDFIDNITHELQTPISALTLAVESLQNFEVTNRKDRFTTYLQVSASELGRLSELVDGILLHSTARQVEEVDKEPIDLMELLREIADRHLIKAEKPVDIHLPAQESFVVLSSRFHLNTILDNLIQNAVRYSDEAGVRIDIRLEPKDDGFILEIADDGWGIEAEDRRHIFEKFYRSTDKDRNYTVKGLGIGLYHVRQCVEALGGSIRVRDNQLRGTVMEVEVG